jgi:hypothetical protein
MNFNSLIKLFVIVLVSFTLFGCTTMVPEYPVKGVQTNTVDKTNPNKEISEEAFYLTKEGAKYKLALAKEETKRVKAQARAANPCVSWFMAPSFCYGYSGGVGYYSGGAGGVNTGFNTGGGGNTRPSRRPGGTNGSFGGGTPPGGNTGGSNTGPAN